MKLSWLHGRKFIIKDEIIYTYLNIVPFGHDYNGANITGISSASYSLFGIPAKDLNIAQSAYLIGLLQSPYGYTPYDEHGKVKPYHLLIEHETSTIRT